MPVEAEVSALVLPFHADVSFPSKRYHKQTRQQPKAARYIYVPILIEKLPSFHLNATKTTIPPGS